MSLEKKYKIVAAVGIVLVTAFLIIFTSSLFSIRSGCSTEPPQETLIEFQRAVNEKRYDDAQALISSSGGFSFGSAGEDEVNAAIFDKMYELYSVEYLSSTVLGGKANITLSVSYMDLRSFAQKVYPIVQQRAYDLSFSGRALSSDEEAIALVSAVEMELLSKGVEEYITTETIEVGMRRTDGVWLIVVNDSFFNTLTGYAEQISDVEFNSAFDTESEEPEAK